MKPIFMGSKLRLVGHTALLLALASFAACGAEKSPISPAPLAPQGAGESDELPAAGFYNNAEGSPLFGMLAGAKRSIDIEIYQMSDADVRAALRSALSRQVTIRVVKDAEP